MTRTPSLPSSFTAALLSCAGILSLGALACSSSGSGNQQGGLAGTGLAVIDSDYTSTSVSLVDPKTGLLAKDDCINSGVQTPIVALALSGDVVLPTQPQPGHELLLIDRASGVLTWVNPGTCEAARQLGLGAKTNPHDVVALSAAKAYVTRYDLDGATGNDVQIIDPTAATAGASIDLSSYAPTVAGATILARPDRALLALGKVYVVLGNLSADYMAAGEGRVVIIDPATDAVTGTIDLPGLKGCSGLDYIEASKTLLVSCGGVFSDAMQAAASGIAAIDLSGATPVMKKMTMATAFNGRALSSVVGFAGVGLGLAVINGDFSGNPPDTLWGFDPTSGTATKILDGGGAFVLGGVASDPAAKRAYVADATMGMARVIVIDAANPAAPTVASSFDPDPARALPPRVIGWY